MRRRPSAEDARSDLVPEVVRCSTVFGEGREEYIAARAPPVDGGHGGSVAARHLDYDLGLAFTQPLRHILAAQCTFVSQRLQVANGGDNAARQFDDPLHRDTVLLGERRVHAEQLGFGQ